MKKINIFRKEEIISRYFSFLDKHLKDVVEGNSPEFLTLKEISVEIAISHQHLTDVMKKSTEKPPRYFYESKILEVAIKMLTDRDMKPAVVAKNLTYDPSNFSKFFKNGQAKLRDNIKINL